MDKKFNDFLAFIGIAILIMSFIETKNLLNEMIGFTTWEEKFYTLFGALLVNAVEVACFVFWYKNRKARFYTAWFAFILGCAFGFLSVIGSLGWFQTKQEISTMQSTEYQTAMKQYESKQKTADEWREKSSNPEIEAWALTKSEKAQIEADQAAARLSSLSKHGAGVGNALYKVFARLGNTDTYTASVVSGMTFSALKEIAAIFTLILGMFGGGITEKKTVKKKVDKKGGHQPINQESSVNVDKKYKNINLELPVNKQIVHLLRSTNFSYQKIVNEIMKTMGEKRSTTHVGNVNKAAGVR